MIEKNSPVPLYEQVKEYIIQDINRQHGEGNLKLRSEREYAEWLHVSRITIRRAIEELVQEKYLTRIVGKGTYIVGSDESSEFSYLLSFTEAMRRKGAEVRSIVLASDIVTAGIELAGKLRRAATEPLFRLKRLRLADDVPMAIQESHLVYALCPGIEKKDFRRESLYRVLAEEYRLKLSFSENTLSARIADAEENDVFGLRAVTPVFVLDQLTFLENDRPFELACSIYRCDKYSFTNIAAGGLQRGS